MKSPLLDALLDSPALPEILEEGRLALEREEALRAKFHEEITPEKNGSSSREKSWCIRPP